jgi:hypothetical protein
MVQSSTNSGDPGGAGVLLEGEVLHGVPEGTDLCRTFPHTRAYGCAYCNSTYPPDADSPRVNSDTGADDDANDVPSQVPQAGDLAVHSQRSVRKRSRQHSAREKRS